jgi:hypothetical protein
VITRYDLTDLRRIEKALSEPLDLEREIHESSKWTFVMDGSRVCRVPRISGASNYTNTYAEVLFANASAGNALASFTAEATMYAATQPNILLPANFFDATYGTGKHLKVILRGIYSTTATPTFTIGLRQDTAAGTIWGSTLAITSRSGVTNLAWELTIDIVAQAPVLASAHNEAVLVALGMLDGVSAGSEGFTNASAIGTQTPTTAVTLTTADASHYLFPTATCGTSNAANKWQMLQAFAYGMN